MASRFIPASPPETVETPDFAGDFHGEPMAQSDVFTSVSS
jgi:hypothetical protein